MFLAIYQKGFLSFFGPSFGHLLVVFGGFGLWRFTFQVMYDHVSPFRKFPLCMPERIDMIYLIN